jgi:hypothetical protein
MWMLLTALVATAEPAPVQVEADFAVHVQGFAAPEVGTVQSSRLLGHPTLEGEVELRTERWGVRLHAGLFPAPLVLDAGLMVLAHEDTPRMARFVGLEAGAARAYFHTRFYAGPVIGVRGPWRAGALTGIVGARLTAGIALDRGSQNDWAFLSPGPAVGFHGGVALTFAPGE